MATKEDLIRSLQHHGDRLFKDNLNISYAAVKPADPMHPEPDDYVLQLGLTEEEFQPPASMPKDAESVFGPGPAPSLPTEIAIPDEHGLIPDKPQMGPVEHVVSGPIMAQAFTGRVRPANGGNSAGNPRYDNAGTLGAAFQHSDGHVYIISNWHVFYGPAGQDGDPILQPARGDGGVYPDDAIALNVHGALDALRDFAVAQVPDTHQHLVSQGTRCFGALNGVRDAAEGMFVKKCGRTTEGTYGQVLSTYAWARINYPWGSMIFVDQLAISEMSQPGDSGSLIQTFDSNEVVGLLFAGGPGVTFANKAQHVFGGLTKAGKAKFLNYPD